MKIILFTNERIYNFTLPMQVLGNFSFDIDENIEDKLIEIRANNNNWEVYSTENSKIYFNDAFVENLILRENTFFVIERNNVKYLIYITYLCDETYKKFIIDKTTNIIIGKTNTCNIVYEHPLIKNEIKLYFNNEEKFIIEKQDNEIVYINDFFVKDNKRIINFGDKIFIFGLKIMLFANIIFINNPNGKITINNLNSNLKELVYNENTNNSEVEIKDRELYKETDYFYKSPRIKRSIEEKRIKIESPPASQNVEEIPLLYTIGPMLTMGITASSTLAYTLMRISSGTTTIANSWVQLLTGTSMLLTTLLWPTLNRRFQKKQRIKKEKERLEKYNKYLENKRKEICEEYNLQKEILFENLIPLSSCAEIIFKKNNSLWSRRIEQDDFLTVRIGTGNVPLKLNIDYSKEDFSMEEDKLKQNVDKLINEFKTINNVPISYSFIEKRITAIMGNSEKVLKLVEAILIQLIAFHSYDDLKIVILTSKNKKYKWEPLKQLQHCFNDSKEIRFFASNNDEIKEVTNYLEEELHLRMSDKKENNENNIIKPRYIIITDNYNGVKRTGFFKQIEKSDQDYGFSLIILENLLARLPSKCNNFISLSNNNSTILEDAYENQKQITFTDEVNMTINLNECIKSLANIPIEFENDTKNIPNKVSFLEMYRVGKIEQLNILNRWKKNDPTKSLKAEVGFDSTGSLVALDIHEKYHGPHGLIAGMTGSGKSEFIITYVLSLAVNYSPEEVSFILIDYKGGGLAGAFENKKTGIRLPHIAGVITNLDKSEMNRTLVSIDSEITRRQKIFNIARDELNESTIDIYKYQSFYREGKVKEPLSHLLIICDEFAELKNQQPDFMDNLISVARLGRSLGVHLILATQKPSGVVNDQIWSNSKFRVCLKVQDKSDSTEMLKRPEAAEIKNVGRFYLQVGYNEYFNLGQAAYCGSKYYPSDIIVKNVDKSISFINSVGSTIKKVDNIEQTKKIAAQGEELPNILNHIIEISKENNLISKRMWLDSLPNTIFIDDLIKKYKITKNDQEIISIIGEYDVPTSQKQGILTLKLDGEGNTIIYGNDETDRELVLNAIIYSTLRYSSSEINYYIIDYGSEQLRRFSKFPQIADYVFAGEEEKLNNLIKLLYTFIQKRKKLFSESGKTFDDINFSEENIPLINVIINNYDSFIENHSILEEDLIKISRDGQRYGINVIISVNNDSTIRSKIRQNFANKFVLRQNDSSNYGSIFGTFKKKILKDVPGRGFVKIDDITEFQTASINQPEYINEHLEKLSSEMKNMKKAIKIPVLPEVIDYNHIKDEIDNITKIPIGVSKKSLDIIKFNFTEQPSTMVLANSLPDTASFMYSLTNIINNIKNVNLIVIDTEKIISEAKQQVKYYYDNDFDKVLDILVNYTKQLKEKQDSINFNSICIILGLDKFVNRIDNKKLCELTETIKTINNFNLIIAEDHKKIKKFEFEEWYRNISNNSSGIWIGLGVANQSVFRVDRILKEMQESNPDDFGWLLKNSKEELIKIINFTGKKAEDNEKR